SPKATVCQFLQRRLASSAASVRPSAAEVRDQRSALFSLEQARQRALYPRTEKIEVTLQKAGLQSTLLGSTCGFSALALVDGKPWPLHQPLTQSCSLSLLTFKDTDPLLVNQAYWRSCAAHLCQVLQDFFKEDLHLHLHLITSGAFCCDVVLDPQLDTWNPSEESLRSLTRGAQQQIHRDLPWEPLEVARYFISIPSQEEVEKSAQSPKGTVMLYRCGDHVLLSGGPLVARTGRCAQYEVTAIHPLGEGEWGLHRRAQGLSLPLQLQAHHTVWRKLRSRAENLVEVPTGSANEAVSDTLTPPSARVGEKRGTEPTLLHLLKIKWDIGL
uniref:Mitochondrial ribosomal protein L39 n=1 Tax=Salmo trutta TaxID=8032 RepID=A0A673Y779_SALTR